MEPVAGSWWPSRSAGQRGRWRQGGRRVELGRVRDAGQELAGGTRSRCVKRAPLPTPLLRQRLESFSPRLSQYCHIAASVEVLTTPPPPKKRLDGCFQGWRGVTGARLDWESWWAPAWLLRVPVSSTPGA